MIFREFVSKKWIPILIGGSMLAYSSGAFTKPVTRQEQQQNYSARPVYEYFTKEPEKHNPLEKFPIYVSVKDAEEARKEIENKDMNLDLWDQALLGRFVVIDDMTAKYSKYFGTDYVWQMSIFAAESGMNPIAQGPKVDDRGLGQIGYFAEETTRKWAKDLMNPFYFPDSAVDGSIWNPETNIILSNILFRSVLGMPQSKSLEKAYAIYTGGQESVRFDGSVESKVKKQVGHATSFRNKINKFIKLKGMYESGKTDEMNDITIKILEIDRKYNDGEEVYSALKDLYISEARKTTGWPMMIYLSESIVFSDILESVYGHDVNNTHKKIYLLLRKNSRIRRIKDSELKKVYDKALADARRKIGQN